MAPKKPRVLLFDIDGTLLSAHGAGRHAFEQAVSDFLGRPTRLEFSFAGGTDRGLARRALSIFGEESPDSAIDAILEIYVNHLGRLLQEESEYTVFSGVQEILDELRLRQSQAKKEMLALGLGTGNVELGARLKLTRGGLNDYFSFGGFGCDAEDRAELIRIGATRGAQLLGLAMDHCEVLVIGDTALDIAAAKAIGAQCLAVATGSVSFDELQAHQPTYCVADLTAPLARQILLDGS